MTLPFTRSSGHSYGLSFQGELPQDMDMETLKIALDYIKDTIGEIN